MAFAPGNAIKEVVEGAISATTAGANLTGQAAATLPAQAAMLAPASKGNGRPYALCSIMSATKNSLAVFAYSARRRTLFV